MTPSPPNAWPASVAGFRGRFETGEAARGAAAGASGILRLLPRAVAVPEDADDLARLVRWAAVSGTPLVPRAGATGMPGGNVGAGVVVELMRTLNRIVWVDAGRRLARVEPGVTRGALNAACARARLHLPVDPSSGDRCTLGGMIANNSAGAHSLRYGAMRPWVRALEVVLATGERARLQRGRAPESPALAAIASRVDAALQSARGAILTRWPRVAKNSSGYALREYLESGDLLDLVVGSEGTLALVTEAEVEVAPLPEHRGLALLEFAKLEEVGAAVQALLPLRPAACELLDRTYLELLQASGAEPTHPLRPGLEGVLLVEFEGADEWSVAASLRKLEAAVDGIAERVTPATDPRRQEALWELRHAASPLIAAQAAAGRVSMQFIEDGVVPVQRLAEYILALRSTLARHGVPAVIFGHAGEGNLHVNPLVDVKDPGWRGTVEAILYEIADHVVALGGTLAGEHGDGRLRAPLLERVWGAETTSLFRVVKDAWDPGGLLNPGVILPLPGQRPFDAVRDFAHRG